MIRPMCAMGALILAWTPLTGLAQPAAPAGAAAQASAADQGPLAGLRWRLVGPFRGGRATGVSGVIGDPNTYYFGASAGGVWKSVDAGVTWKPLWDRFPEASQAVGALAVAPSDPKIVYAGTGEANIRGDVVTGNGLYKSTDAGKTWRYAGLRDTQIIGRIIVDPKDPNRLFVAALGHVFGDNAQRGIFRSDDGGATWKKVLFVDDKTGGVDVAFDPHNPKVLWAGMWQVYRKPWIMESGGPGGGLFKSVDGGATWRRLGGGGLPEGVLGRVNVAPTSDPQRVYAMIEAKQGGLYRTDDAGKTWTLVNDRNDYRQRAWYFNTVFADPKDPNIVYVLNTRAYRSTDAGKTFKVLHTRHGDNHELWIDPTNPRRMISSNDGGANISVDNGETWTSVMNQPTGQFYHVAADDAFPFRLYGAQQDSSTVSIATAGSEGGVGVQDWYDVGGGESGYVVPDPTDGEIVYAGGYDAQLTRYDHRTGNLRQITPWPRNIMGWAAKDLPYRFQWTAPIMVSKHDGHALYFGAQVLFRSTDQGQTWTVVSPDLTRNDKSRQQSSGGPITKDNTSIETFDTIFSIAESPVADGLIWVGSDDGLIHITRDGGAHWTDVTPPAMPAWATVDMVEADPHDPAVAYVAADRHRLDDPAPYAFRTADYGRTWTTITAGVPADAYVHVVRADPEREGLLYAGTERGVFVSYDDGARWAPLQLNLPVAPVHDLIVHGASLAAATHGRAFWIIDDLGPVRQWTPQATGSQVHLFRPAPASHTIFPTRSDELRDGGGANPPAGLAVSYYLPSSIGTPAPSPDQTPEQAQEAAKAPDPLASRLRLEILDADGAVLRTIPDPRLPAHPAETVKPVAGVAGVSGTAAVADTQEDEEAVGPPPPKLPHVAGLNTFVWDLRYEGATAIPHSPLWAGSVAGPKALPGRYQVRLTVDGVSQTQPFEIVPDPRAHATPDQLKAQFELHAAIEAQLDAVHKAVLQIRAARARLTAAAASSKAPSARPAADALIARMDAVEEALIQPRAHASEDALNFPVRLNNMLAALGVLVGSGDAPPTTQDIEMFAQLKAESDRQLEAWRRVEDVDLPALEKQLVA
jgi:photosystem II stability/assembly factor-like uncharacterized protein